MLGFARNVLAVAEAYGSLLGGFTREFVAFKAKLHALCVCTVADFAELGKRRFAFWGISRRQFRKHQFSFQSSSC